MKGPDEGLRNEVAKLIDDLATEEDLYGILERIEGAVRDDAPGGPETEYEASDELAAVDAWAALASDAVQALYAPGSLNLLRRKGHDLAGWSKTAAEKLRRIADALRGALRAVARVLRAIAFTVGVSFPWGISISISFPS